MIRDVQLERLGEGAGLQWREGLEGLVQDRGTRPEHVGRADGELPVYAIAHEH